MLAQKQLVGHIAFIFVQLRWQGVHSICCSCLAEAERCCQPWLFDVYTLDMAKRKARNRNQTVLESLHSAEGTHRSPFRGGSCLAPCLLHYSSSSIFGTH